FSNSNTGDDDDREEQEESPDDKIVREHRAIYDALDRRMRRFAELVKRETGVHSLWLGYPLLYVVVGADDAQQWILAPVFLWPVSIYLDRAQEGRVLIERERIGSKRNSWSAAKFNRAMASWIQRQLNFDLLGPTEDQIEQLSWPELQSQLVSLAG